MCFDLYFEPIVVKIKFINFYGLNQKKPRLITGQGFSKTHINN